MAENSELAADFVTILSSELIAQVVEAYFNSVLYKKGVKVVDLKPTADGYAFSLAFVRENEVDVTVIAAQKVDSINNGVKYDEVRDKKGRFTTKGIQDDPTKHQTTARGLL